MVFFFTCIDPRFILYMGIDKHENEHLIEHGWPTDVWFHVDNLSSAHVYLRMPSDMRIEDIPPEVIEDCCQLVKANSIQGCKLNNVPVVYTPWSNLKKTADMDVGQVGFHKGKLVRRTHVTKDKEIVKRLNKTKEERFPDLAAEKAEYEAEIRRAEKARRREERAAKERAKAEKRQQDELKAYTSLMVEDEMTSNKHGQSYEEFEDDFM